MLCSAEPSGSPRAGARHARSCPRARNPGAKRARAGNPADATNQPQRRAPADAIHSRQ
ncbi:hypothetical protein BC834DRAFT_867130 [Gloeopeniophorella convolvens]|nr:hypothetical protein BC834DRAFT_867130 [Gloeopeniophorella convolvens]